MANSQSQKRHYVVAEQDHFDLTRHKYATDQEDAINQFIEDIEAEYGDLEDYGDTFSIFCVPESNVTEWELLVETRPKYSLTKMT